MTYKGASFLILFWGITNLLSGGIAYYYMGSFAQAILVLGFLAGILGFSLGHFLNRERKQAFILSLATCLVYVFLFGWLTMDAFNQEQNFIFPDALAVPSRNIYLLVSSALLTSTVLVLATLIVFMKPIYTSFKSTSWIFLGKD